MSERHDLYDLDFAADGSVVCGCGKSEHDPVHDPAVKVTHVVIGQGYFWNATSEEEALTGWRRIGGRDRHGYSVLEFPEGVTYLGVNGTGSVQWRYDTTPHIEPYVTEHPNIRVVNGKRVHRKAN
jgi:hypothetical protein